MELSELEQIFELMMGDFPADSYREWEDVARVRSLRSGDVTIEFYAESNYEGLYVHSPHGQDQNLRPYPIGIRVERNTEGVYHTQLDLDERFNQHYTMLLARRAKANEEEAPTPLEDLPRPVRIEIMLKQFYHLAQVQPDQERWAA